MDVHSSFLMNGFLGMDITMDIAWDTSTREGPVMIIDNLHGTIAAPCQLCSTPPSPASFKCPPKSFTFSADLHRSVLGFELERDHQPGPSHRYQGPVETRRFPRKDPRITSRDSYTQLPKPFFYYFFRSTTS